MGRLQLVLQQLRLTPRPETPRVGWVGSMGGHGGTRGRGSCGGAHLRLELGHLRGVEQRDRVAARSAGPVKQSSRQRRQNSRSATSLERRFGSAAIGGKNMAAGRGGLSRDSSQLPLRI